jgi:hypothetical protein
VWSDNSQLKCCSSVPVQVAVSGTRIVREEHYTGCQHSTPFVPNIRPYAFFFFFFFRVSHNTSDVIVVPCCKNSTISTPLLSKKSCHGLLADNVCLNFLGLFGEYVHIHCFGYSLVSSFTNETRVLSPLTCMM